MRGRTRGTDAGSLGGRGKPEEPMVEKIGVVPTKGKTKHARTHLCVFFLGVGVGINGELEFWGFVFKEINWSLG